MASLYDKVSALFMGNLHALVDKAIDMNSIPVVKQHIRQLENARNDIASQTAIQTGRVNSLRSEIGRIEQELKVANDNIDLLLGDSDPTNDARAVTIQLRVNGLKQKIAGRTEDLKVAEQTATAMNQALKKIKDRHKTMVDQIASLESLERQAAAKESAAKALKQVGGLANTGDGVSIDNVEQRLRDRSAAADAILNQQLDSIAENSDETEELARAKRDIEDRRNALKGSASAA